MTLARRVFLLFLLAIGTVLAVCSAGFYVFVRETLYTRFDAELHDALRILSASVEIESDDVKWDPAEHGLTIEVDVKGDIGWLVADERGQVIDRSPSLKQRSDEYEAALAFVRRDRTSPDVPEHVGPWRMVQRRHTAPAPKSAIEREPHEFAVVSVVVMRSTVSLDALLARLGVFAVVVPAIVCFGVAFAGRVYIRYALRPMSMMVQQAHAMGPHDLHRRFPVSSTGDELTALEQSFNRLLDQLQEAFDRRSRFAADAAHQLRTPLAILQGHADVAIRRDRPADDYRQTLALIRNQSIELRNIVDSLLFFARAEEVGAVPDVQEIDVRNWARSTAARWQSHERTDDLKVLVGNDEVYFGSPSLLNQLADALIDNAFKYSIAKTPVELRIESSNCMLVVTVSDRGHGIATEDTPAIFDPFVRLDHARRSGAVGAGLGLSIVRRIAEALGGSVRCDSVVGDGTRMVITLPSVTPGPMARPPSEER